MSKTFVKTCNLILGLAAVFLLIGGIPAHAAIDGVTGTTFNLTAKSGYINTPDGNSIFMWGYALNGGTMQFPGPTMIVNQGATVAVTLSNELTVPVSIVFPGHEVVASGGAPGLITMEAAPGGTVSYTFVASEPGTYTYHSGTRPDLQIEMGLVGALIVRPTTNPSTQAYNDPGSAFDHEYLFLLSDMDPDFHVLVEQGFMDQVDTTTFFPVYWFINGRAAPDTMAEAFSPLLPTQPYNCMPMTHPGEKILLRTIGAGRDPHPYHTHGNHHRVIARDGRLLESAPGAGADLGELAFTTTVYPGSTADALFVWTGEKLGWDMYGPVDTACTDTDQDGRDDTTNQFCHDATCVDADLDGFDDVIKEYCADHGKDFPVILPNQLDLTFGQFWSGSPFLGALGALPPGEGGFNPNGGFLFMWHSHSEKEIVNNDIFPGGMLTMMIVEHPFVTLMNP